MILFVKFENMPKCLYWQALNYDEKFKNIEKHEKIQRKKKEKRIPNTEISLDSFSFPETKWREWAGEAKLL